jgi:hypothetical protein
VHGTTVAVPELIGDRLVSASGGAELHRAGPSGSGQSTS